MERWRWLDLGARPAFFPAACIVVGAWLGGSTARPPGIFLCASFALAGVALFARRKAGAHGALLAGLVFLGGALAAWQKTVRVPAGLLDAPVRVEGRVEGIKSFPDGDQVTLEVSRVPDLPSPEAHFRARLYCHLPIDVVEGQRIQVATQLRAEQPPNNPGEANEFESRRRRGLLFHGGFDARRLVVLSPASRFQRWLARTRRQLAARVAQTSPSADASSLYLTLAAGLRAQLDESVEDDFAKSGLAHVLSVSGLHVAALAIAALHALRWLLVRWTAVFRAQDARQWAAPLCLPIVWAYVLFTGYQPPAVRSAVMATAVLAGLSLRRRTDGLNSLALAALALTVWDPASVSELSLQLSFTAVGVLILLTPALRTAVPLTSPDPAVPFYRLQKAREWAVATFCASAAATLGSVPFAASTFHRISLAGLVSNIVCLPLCGLLALLAAGGGALFVVAPLAARPVLFAGAWASQLMLLCTRVFSSIPGAALPVPSMSAWSGAAYLGGLLAFALGRDRARWLGLAAPTALCCAFILPGALPSAGLSITFLSVGHGDAIVLNAGGHYALVDGGGVPGGTDTGKKFVIPFLREHNVHALDLVVLSHPHPDHALGLISTLPEIPTARLWLPAGNSDGDLTLKLRTAAAGAVIEEVEEGLAPYRLGDAEIRVLGPPKDRILLKGVNDRSVVLHVQHGAVSFLLTGDIERFGEEALPPVGPITVLKAPHHGSKTSSIPSFVAQVKPRYVVFCVGAANRFHFPNPGVVERYLAAGAHCLRTDLDGAVTFDSDGRDVRLTTFQASDSEEIAPDG